MVVARKSTIAAALSLKCGITIEQAGRFIDELWRVGIEELAAGRPLKLGALGKIIPVKGGPRMARNPRTGAPVPLAAHFRVRFRSGKRLKAALKGAQ